MYPAALLPAGSRGHSRHLEERQGVVSVDLCGSRCLPSAPSSMDWTNMSMYLSPAWNPSSGTPSPVDTPEIAAEAAKIVEGSMEQIDAAQAKELITGRTHRQAV